MLIRTMVNTYKNYCLLDRDENIRPYGSYISGTQISVFLSGCLESREPIEMYVTVLIAMEV